MYQKLSLQELESIEAIDFTEVGLVLNSPVYDDAIGEAASEAANA